LNRPQGKEDLMANSHPATVLRSLKLTYDSSNIHDRWYLVQWDCRGELHEILLPARTRDEALKYVQDRLQALKVNGSGRWSSRELGFGFWGASSTLWQSRDNDNFWTPEMRARVEAAELDSIAKIRAAFDREIQRLDTLQRQFDQWAADNAQERPNPG